MMLMAVGALGDEAPPPPVAPIPPPLPPLPADAHTSSPSPGSSSQIQSGALPPPPGHLLLSMMAMGRHVMEQMADRTSRVAETV
ncbi:uncharacterized protein [Periplaneta americana]